MLHTAPEFEAPLLPLENPFYNIDKNLFFFI